MSKNFIFPARLESWEKRYGKEFDVQGLGDVMTYIASLFRDSMNQAAELELMAQESESMPVKQARTFLSQGQSAIWSSIVTEILGIYWSHFGIVFDKLKELDDLVEPWRGPASQDDGGEAINQIGEAANQVYKALVSVVEINVGDIPDPQEFFTRKAEQQPHIMFFEEGGEA